MVGRVLTTELRAEVAAELVLFIDTKCNTCTCLPLDATRNRRHDEYPLMQWNSYSPRERAANSDFGFWTHFDDLSYFPPLNDFLSVDEIDQYCLSSYEFSVS